MGQTALDRPGPRIAGLLRLSHWVSGTPRAAGGNRGRWPCWTCWPPLARVPSLQAAFSHARCLRVRSHPSSCWFMTNKRLCINILFYMLNSFYFCRKEKIEKSKFVIRESQFCMSVGDVAFGCPSGGKADTANWKFTPCNGTQRLAQPPGSVSGADRLVQQWGSHWAWPLSPAGTRSPESGAVGADVGVG